MLTVELFGYQNFAVDKAIERGNLLIAYSMGLGKTLIQLAICEELLGTGDVTLNALVVPASLKWQWAQAIAWATDVPTREIKMKSQKIIVPGPSACIVIDGTPKRRDYLYRRVRDERPDYVILGYENVINDWRDVRRMEPELIACDEIAAIKSFTSERSKRIKLWQAPYRFGLTGTPIDNRADELFSIMEWIDPEALGRADIFERTYVVRDGYGRVQRYKHLDVLHTKIQDFVARKTRFDTDVAPFMPKDDHKEIYVDLAPKVKSLYKGIAGELLENLEEMVGDPSFSIDAYYGGEQMNGSSEQGRVMSMVMALNMLCDHPSLLKHSADEFEAWMEEQEDKPSRGSKYASELAAEGSLDIPLTSPKFDRVVADVRDLLEENPDNKIIVFSFYKQMLALLEKEFGKTAVVFTGDLNTTQKEEVKMQFKRDPGTRVFLSSDAGGMGVDLPEAQYLINVDLPSSAGKSDQRNSRHVRAGSAFEEVYVINYLVEDSVEHLVNFERLKFKRAIGSAILDGAKTREGGVLHNDVVALKDALTHGI